MAAARQFFLLLIYFSRKPAENARGKKSCGALA
jgi:hypothetical protein